MCVDNDSRPPITPIAGGSAGGKDLQLTSADGTTFMAYAAHQLNVLAEFANPAESPPVCWLVAPAELLNGIDRRELDRRAECLRMWEEQNCSWDVIATRLGRALAIENGAADRN